MSGAPHSRSSEPRPDILGLSGHKLAGTPDVEQSIESGASPVRTAGKATCFKVRSAPDRLCKTELRLDLQGTLIIRRNVRVTSVLPHSWLVFELMVM